MNQPIDNNGNDPTLDRLLQQAFASRDGSDSRASLHDVRQRARRHQRRRAGAMVGAAALVGAGGVAVLTRDGKPATTAGDAATTTAPARVNSCSTPAGVWTTDSPIAGLATTTTFQFETTTTVEATGAAIDTIDAPATVVPTSGVLTTAPPTAPTASPTAVPTTTTSPEGVVTTIEVEPSADLSGCLPPGAFRCSAPLGSDDQGFTYYAFCEPADGGWTAYPTTTIDAAGTAGIVIVDSSGGLDGAADDMVGRLEGTGLGVITVVPGTRTFGQTMLMPTSDSSGLDIVRQLTGIDGFDTWSSDLIDAPLPPGTMAVVVIGEDYWTRMTPTVQTTTTTG